MSGHRADAERLAIPELSSDLRAYVARMQQAQAGVEQRFGAAEQVAERAINQARRNVSAAMARLDSCRADDDSDCSWPAAEVDRAERHLEQMHAVAREIAALRTGHRSAARRFGSALDVLGQAAQRELNRAGETLDVYLGGTSAGRGTVKSGGLPVWGAASSGGGSVTQPAGFPVDIVMVPLALIDDSGSGVGGPADFGKGYSASDLEWALEKFISIVMPDVARGATLDDFRARDHREGRMGTRSYEMTYCGFFGGDAITLSSHSSTYGVGNGYHRIWVAKRMGLDSVPARVRD